MKAERQHREVASRVSQQLKGCEGRPFVDNRPESFLQKKQLQAIQMQTSLNYYQRLLVPPETPIEGISHSRVNMSSTERISALRPEGYVPTAGEVCNHSISYKIIRDRINDGLSNVSLAEGLENIGFSFSAEDCRHEGGYDMNLLNERIDDYIAELANNPRNLFYWPGHLGDENGNAIDYPTFNPELAMDYGWTMSILHDYRKKIEDILGPLE